MTSTGTILALVNGSCVGLPANAAYYGSGTSYTLANAFNGTSLTGSFSASTPATNTCQFNCTSGYSWSGTGCLVSSVNGACTGLPANAIYYGSVTSYTLAGAALGTSLTASYTGGTLIPNSCMYGCASGYGWNGSTCVQAHNIVYVTNVNSDTVSVIDGATNAILSTIATSHLPRGIAINPTTNRAYVVNQGGNLDVINTVTNTLVTSITSVARAQGVAINTTTNRIYAGNDSANTVSVIDGATNTLITTISVGSQPNFPVVNATTNKIYIANYASNTVSVIDGTTNAVTATIAV